MTRREHSYGRDNEHGKMHDRGHGPGRGRARGASRAYAGRCRIIAGRLRGRIIQFDDAEGLRPTTDRIRETVFNWLQPSIAGRHCLDAFAGSGALGFEALSRGALQVTFLENARQSAVNLEANIEVLLGAQTAQTAQTAQAAEVIHVDTMHWLSALNKAMLHGKKTAGYDLVFLDPPYHSGLLAECCRLLVDSGCLSPNAIIYIEHAVDDDVELPQGWSCIRHKQTANITYGLYIAASSGS